MLAGATFDRVVVCGIAGGLAPASVVGDLVVPEEVYDSANGDRFRSTPVSGVTPKGVFVRVSEPPVEGRLMRGEQGVDVGDEIQVTLLSTDVQLDRLPVITCWPEDGGPFITLPLVYTTHPDRHGHNLGMYRMQVYDGRTTGMHWQIGKGGGFHYAAAEARGATLPATVFLGGPPALILSAVAPLPENVPELMLASLIAGERLPQVHGHGPHPLIANAEFALIGSVAPKVRRPEGPFGDHYGYYSLRHDYPVFDVARLAHRTDAIYPATVVGKPRQEDFYLGDYLQQLLLPLARKTVIGCRIATAPKWVEARPDHFAGSCPSLQLPGTCHGRRRY